MQLHELAARGGLALAHELGDQGLGAGELMELHGDSVEVDV